MTESRPLSQLLSQVLVAFTIEFDNEFELRLSKTWARPFLTSMVMWSNFMRHVTPEGVTVADLSERSCVASDAVASLVGGLERWRYIAVDHDPATGVASPRKGFGTGRGVRPGTVIRPSMSGDVARGIWEPLADEVEERWRVRLGEQRVDDLVGAVKAVSRNFDTAMPSYLPVVGGRGLFAAPAVALRPGGPATDGALAALVSRVLLAFALDYEAASDVSLAIAANLLRVASATGTRVADLPLAIGVSKEAVAVSTTWLVNEACITVGAAPNGRGKVVTLTDNGREAQAAHDARLADVERQWMARFEPDALASLRAALESILDEPGGSDGPLAAGLVPPSTGWRAKGRYQPLTAAFVQSPGDALPRHPMVLHRGGWPDGS